MKYITNTINQSHNIFKSYLNDIRHHSLPYYANIEQQTLHIICFLLVKILCFRKMPTLLWFRIKLIALCHVSRLCSLCFNDYLSCPVLIVIIVAGHKRLKLSVIEVHALVFILCLRCLKLFNLWLLVMIC